MSNQRIYGKRTTARAKLTSQCFLAWSSPVKPPALAAVAEKSHGLSRSDDDGSVVEKQEQITKAQDEVTIDDAVEQLKRLQIGDEEEEEEETMSKKTREEAEVEVEVLETRDVNKGPTQRIRRKLYLEKPPKALVKEPQSQSKATSCATSPPADNATPVTSEQAALDTSIRARTPRGRRPLRSQTSPSSSAQVYPPELILYTQSLLRLCGDTDGRTAPRDFQHWSDSLSRYFTISKIAEASYGEVYRLGLLSPNTEFSRADESVLKIVALKPPPHKPLAECTANGQRNPSAASAKETKKTLAMSAVMDVASEVRLLQRMSPVPGFTRFRDVSVMSGRLPRQFVAAWRTFNRDVKKSLFPDPGRKTSYSEDQLWAVVEMQDAGTDLETLIERGDGTLDNVEAVWDVFWGIACAVAKGEEWAGFEHRDLHLGNICVRHAPPASDKPPTPHDSRPPQSSRKLGFTNLETTIIDYTLSRASMRDGTSSTTNSIVAPTQSQTTNTGTNTDSVAPGYYDRNDNDSSDGTSTAFFDLSKDPSIFSGDSAENYQYDIYRLMRSAVLFGDPTREIAELRTEASTTAGLKAGKGRGGKAREQRHQQQAQRAQEKQAWKQHHPLTNLVWLHFVLHELTRQPHVSAALLNPPPPGLTIQQGPGSQTEELDLAPKLCRLREMLRLEGMTSAVHVEVEVEHPGRGKRGWDGPRKHGQDGRAVNLRLDSAAALVLWAVAEGWLAEEDVVGVGDGIWVGDAGAGAGAD